MKRIGSVRKRLARKIVAALKEQGIEARCEPQNLRPAQGYWRQIEQDVQAWEGSVETKIGDRWSVRSIGSWDRMSDCVKGLSIKRERDGFGLEVSAKEPTDPANRFRILRLAARQSA
jgi:hypothetical protein